MAYFSGQGVVKTADASTVAAAADATAAGTAYAALSFVDVGNVPDFKVNLNTTIAEHKESTSGNRVTDGRLIKENKATISMTLEDLSVPNLTIALYGSATGGEQVVTDTAITATAVPAVFMFKGVPTERAVKFDGFNTAASNKRVVVELFRVIFDPLKTLDVINDDFAKWQLEGSCMRAALLSANAKYLGGFGRVVIYAT